MPQPKKKNIPVDRRVRVKLRDTPRIATHEAAFIRTKPGTLIPVARRRYPDRVFFDHSKLPGAKSIMHTHTPTKGTRFVDARPSIPDLDFSISILRKHGIRVHWITSINPRGEPIGTIAIKLPSDFKQRIRKSSLLAQAVKEIDDLATGTKYTQQRRLAGKKGAMKRYPLLHAHMQQDRAEEHAVDILREFGIRMRPVPAPKMKYGKGHFSRKPSKAEKSQRRT